MRVYFSTPMFQKAFVDVGEEETVVGLRRAIVAKNVLLERATLPEDEADNTARTRVAPGDDIDVYFGMCLLEPGRFLSEYDMGVEGKKGGVEGEVIVVHPKWISVSPTQRSIEAGKDGNDYLVSRVDAKRGIHLVESLAIVDPDFWLELWERASADVGRRWETVWGHWQDGQHKAAIDSTVSSPYWPGDHVDPCIR